MEKENSVQQQVRSLSVLLMPYHCRQSSFTTASLPLLALLGTPFVVGEDSCLYLPRPVNPIFALRPL